MKFNIALNKLIDKINCTNKELATKSNLSSSLISRYRSGERCPKNDNLNALIEGLYKIAKIKNIPLTKNDIINKFSSVVDMKDYDFKNIKNNLNNLIDELNINVAELSSYLKYDPSFLSKIRSGVRVPAKGDEFINGVCSYLVSNEKYNSKIMEIIKYDEDYDKEKYTKEIKRYLCSNSDEQNISVDNFITNIDKFNLNEYISVIHFDELKVPKVPFQFPISKTYYGLEEMKQAEVDFFKATVLSKSNDDIFLCSDMQMDDMAKDVEFGKKWMLAIAISLKKGLHINIIHDIDRPFNELMLGLESWIPIYMTGQISPYYFKDNVNHIYSHLNYVSGEYSLCGECIKNHHSEGKYYLTSNKKENEYYKRKAKLLIENANSLMEIYNNERKNEFLLFLEQDCKIVGNRKRILSSLPLHTISEKSLMDLLMINDVDGDIAGIVMSCYHKEVDYIKAITNFNKFEDEFKVLTLDDFEKEDQFLDLDKYFIDFKIKYSYESYLKHYEETKKYNDVNYSYTINNNISFKNMDVYINKDNFAVITKRRNPNIQFIIEHPVLVNAILNFVPPIKEKKV